MAGQLRSSARNWSPTFLLLTDSILLSKAGGMTNLIAKHDWQLPINCGRNEKSWARYIAPKSSVAISLHGGPDGIPRSTGNGGNPKRHLTAMEAQHFS